MRTARIVFIIILAGILGFLAYTLYQKQYNKYTFISFKIENEISSVYIPNLDRLTNKINSSSQLDIHELNADLSIGIDKLLHNGKRYSTVVGEECFFSFNATDFILVFNNPDLFYSDLESVLENDFGANVSYSEGKFQIDDQTFFTGQYNTYTVFSNREIAVQPDKHQKFDRYSIGNADYAVLKDSVNTVRHILSDNRHYVVETSIDGNIKGRPVDHQFFIQKVPVGFDSAFFYGSLRFTEDITGFFKEPENEAFAWVDNGLAIIKKDSFELLIAPQNDERDLKLILEEQTLAGMGDTGLINYFNLKSFEIMSFKSEFDWQNSIAPLESPLRYYTEYENYNVLANSISGMRWYLSQIQTGNLISDNDELFEYYHGSVPLKSHQLKLILSQNAEYLRVEADIWKKKTERTHTQTEIALVETADDEVENSEFFVTLQPKYILPYKQNGSEFILLSGENTLALYSASGEEKWKYNVPGELRQKPEIIDLENDGTFEIACFTSNHFVILGANGEPKPNLSVPLQVESQGGIALNYDNSYNYRFLIIQGNQIVSYNEAGALVTGWQFAGSSTPIRGPIFYTQIAGKDYIAFKNSSNEQFALNRRGENRFTQTYQFKLNNESNFIIGENEATLRKLGYNNQYIQNLYLNTGHRDSVKLDQRVNAVNARWILNGNTPLLLIDEPGRVVVFNAFGYVEQEILKPEGAGIFKDLHTSPAFRYVFFDNSKNSLYLLDEGGRQLFTSETNTYEWYGISATRFYTFNGKKIKQYKLN